MNNLYKELQDIASANALLAPYMNSIPNMGKNCNALAAVNARCAEIQAAYAKQAPSIQQAFELYAQIYPVLQQFAKAYPDLLRQAQAMAHPPEQDSQTLIERLNEIIADMPVPGTWHNAINKKKSIVSLIAINEVLDSLKDVGFDDSVTNAIGILTAITTLILVILNLGDEKPTYK